MKSECYLEIYASLLNEIKKFLKIQAFFKWKKNILTIRSMV